jgi:hypothetical protein
LPKAIEELVTQPRLGIEHVELDVLFQVRQLALPYPLIGCGFLIRQVLQLIVMRFDSIKRSVDRVT